MGDSEYPHLAWSRGKECAEPDANLCDCSEYSIDLSNEDCAEEFRDDQTGSSSQLCCLSSDEDTDEWYLICDAPFKLLRLSCSNGAPFEEGPHLSALLCL